jgi:chromosome segregation ATPase
VFEKLKRGARPPKGQSEDFYWNLVKEADAKAVAASKARDAAAAEAERLDARVRELEDQLEPLRATAELRDRQLGELGFAHDAAKAEASRLGNALDEQTGELETTRATLELRDRQFADLGAAHGELQQAAAASAERITELESRVQALTGERAAAIAAAETVRRTADQQVTAMRGERDRLRAELDSTLEAIMGLAERHRAELAAECRRALKRAGEARSGGEQPTDAALEGRRNGAAVAPAGQG